MGGVFISYRSDDVPMVAGAVYDHLVRRFGAERVFRDSASMRSGEFYPAAICEGLERSSVLVAVIGPAWLHARDKDGDRRLDDRRDWVRTEIAWALDNGITVVPLLADEVAVPHGDDLPECMRGLVHRQASRISHHHPIDDIAALADRLVEIDPTLAVDELIAPPPLLPTRSPPSALLRAEYSVVPFIGRTRELNQLRTWAMGPEPVSLRLVVGPGGQGKTRLAQQLCLHLGRDGWVAGMVREQASAPVLGRCAALSTPLLLVVDYAETRSEQLTTMLSALAAGRGPRHRVRLLLLARSERGGWLGLGGRLTDPVRNLLATLPDEPLRLAPLLPDDRGRQVEFDRAVSAFAGQLSRSVAGIPAPAELDHERYEQALDVHAAALASLLDHPDDRVEQRPRWQDPIERVLRHERDYWSRSAAGLPSADPVRLDQIAAAATLFGAADLAQAERVLEALPSMDGLPGADRRAYLAWFRTLYPGPRGLNALQPDRLGEDHAATTIEDEPGTALGPATAADDAQLTQALTVLGRAAPRHDHLAETMTAIMAAAPDRMAPLGLAVVPRLPDPASLVRALDLAVGRAAPTTLTRLIDIIDAMPTRSMSLGDFAVRTTATALALHRGQPRPDRFRIATTLAGHCRHLAAVGSWHEAEQAIAEAVRLLTPLSRVFELARALRTRAWLLGTLGRHREACDAAGDAVRWCETADAPAELAGSLTGWAAAHAQLGRHQDAVEIAGRAAALYRDLVNAQPDGFQDQLARSLTVLAGHLADSGRVEDSIRIQSEATSLWSALAARHHNLYAPQLALHLVATAQTLLVVGHDEAAFAVVDEAVALYRELAAEQPDLRRPELAEAMDSLTTVLAVAGRLQRALAVMTELVRLRRDLARLVPGVQDHYLARSLRLQAELQRRCGDVEAGYATADEAIARYRALPADGPLHHCSELADLRKAMADWFTADGRYDEAAVAGVEAVRLCRTLARRWQERHLPELARTLVFAAQVLMSADRLDEAGAAMAEGVTILRGLADDDPRHAAEYTEAVELGRLLGLG